MGSPSSFTSPVNPNSSCRSSLQTSSRSSLQTSTRSSLQTSTGQSKLLQSVLSPNLQSVLSPNLQSVLSPNLHRSLQTAPVSRLSKLRHHGRQLRPQEQRELRCFPQDHRSPC